MDVCWRLFARDVLSMKPDSAGDFSFGSPPRAVRAIRILGLVVHRSKMGPESSDLPRDKNVPKGADESDVGALDPCCLGVIGLDVAADSGKWSPSGMTRSLMSVVSERRQAAGTSAADDGTGVIEVRLPLALWGSVALGDQVDVVGRLQRTPADACLRGEVSAVYLLAEGCHVETDPKVETLRPLECIKLYKLCYFCRSWSPSTTVVPPLRPNPYPSGKPPEHPTERSAAGTVPRRDLARGHEPSRDSNGERRPAEMESGTSAPVGGKRGNGGSSGPPCLSLEERLLEVISSPKAAGDGATVEQLHMALRVPLGDEALAAALEQMQLAGAIYMAGNRYMSL